MTEYVTTVKLDLDADFVYGETADEIITAAVHDIVIRRGRDQDISQAEVGTCVMTLRNDDGKYTPRNNGSALYDSFHPMAGVQVASTAPAAADHFTGFIRKIYVHPRGDQQYATVECADWLWVLSRVDVSLPLMRDVRPDMLMHRVVDAAEVNPLITNDHFKDDSDDDGLPDDWFEWSGANVTTALPTDAPSFQDPHVLAVTVTTVATDRGVAQAGSASDRNGVDVRGETVELAFYVRADTAADVGETVEALIMETGPGAGTTRSGTLALTEEWQRIEVERAIDAGALQLYFFVVAPSTETTAFTFRVGAAHGTLKRNAVPRSFDIGQSLFAYVGPRRVNALQAIREAAENELGGLVYVDGSGTLTFEDRHHRWRETEGRVSQGTVDETMVDLPYEEDAEDLIGLVEFGYAQWIEGAPGTQVWAADRLPIAIGPNASETVEIDYWAIVRDAIVPVANTDYYIGSTPTGGADESGNVTLAFEDWGAGAQAVFTNTVARTVYLHTSFVVRGTPVREASDTPQVVYTPSGTSDMASKLTFFYRLQSAHAHVEAWSHYLGDRYVAQRERLPVALVNKTSALLTQMLARKLSERVTITADNAAYSPKVNGPYYIDSIEHRFSTGATLLQSKWGVVPADVSYFIIGTSLIDGADVIAP